MQQSLGGTLISFTPLSNLNNSGWFQEKCVPQLPSNAGWGSLFLSYWVLFLLFKSVCSVSIFSRHLDKTWGVNACLANPEGILCCSFPSFMKAREMLSNNTIILIGFTQGSQAVTSSGSLSVWMQTSLWGHYLDWKCNRDREMSIEHNSDSQLWRVLQEWQISSQPETLGRKIAKTQSRSIWKYSVRGECHKTGDTDNDKKTVPKRKLASSQHKGCCKGNFQ